MTARHCQSCGARIIFARTEKGKRQPLDWQPDPAGIVAAYCDALGQWHARHAKPGTEVVAPEKRYTPHQATCPAMPRGSDKPAPGDVAERLQMGKSKVFEFLASGQLKSLQIGRARRVTEQQLADFIEQRIALTVVRKGT